jgi:thiaminase (transcriptional activator TenA)
MKFSEVIRTEANDIWQANFQHPFIQELRDGTLPLEKFKYYVLQDSYYLTHFAKVQALAAAKATDFSMTERMAVHAQNTYKAEGGLHETFMKQLGITEEEKRRFKPAPTAYAYTSHLYRAAFEGHVGDIIAAILPCYWIYYEIGNLLKDAKPGIDIYEQWIAAYHSEWFEELVNEQVANLDSIAEQDTEVGRLRMKQHFITSSEYEYAFWQMAYTLEQWPASEHLLSI